jgi:type II secretory pathway pseudopilin PulG
MSTISALQQQVQLLEAELQAVRAEIMKHKYKHTSTATIPTTSAPLVSPQADISMIPVPTPSATTLAPSSSLYNASTNSTNTDYNSISNSEDITFFG